MKDFDAPHLNVLHGEKFIEPKVIANNDSRVTVLSKIRTSFGSRRPPVQHHVKPWIVSSCS
ncbi:hypothetical protein [Pacificibacter marinus]|uniref:hypothetical protein n=1 Tax=Pacificibacter marinus TaxID=658057 RepID=UPI001C069FB9|nr:hypothetical protein [Pacificibacter marinus]MBU2866340.1 hypothetical protein [Pacificibacter marinus]